MRIYKVLLHYPETIPCSAPTVIHLPALVERYRNTIGRGSTECFRALPWAKARSFSVCTSDRATKSVRSVDLSSRFNRGCRSRHLFNWPTSPAVLRTTRITCIAPHMARSRRAGLTLLPARPHGYETVLSGRHLEILKKYKVLYPRLQVVHVQR
jgi:hypothetical protein